MHWASMLTVFSCFKAISSELSTCSCDSIGVRGLKRRDGADLRRVSDWGADRRLNGLRGVDCAYRWGLTGSKLLEALLAAIFSTLRRFLLGVSEIRSRGFNINGAAPLVIYKCQRFLRMAGMGNMHTSA